MSAFEVPTVHIDAMLTAALVWTEPGQGGGALRWLWPTPDAATDRGSWTSRELLEQVARSRRELTEDSAGRVGAMLLAENRASVDHRYDENEIEAPYLFTRLPGRPDPAVVLKAVACLEYQSCEHPGWIASEAKRFCDALRLLAISRLPGYRDAPWPICTAAVFVAPSGDAAQ
jgi:hypothetical protein